MERNFEIIGEAVRRLATIDPVAAGRLGDYPKIISFRNVLIHGYDLIVHELVWHVAQRDLPELLERLAEMADEP